MQSVYLNFAAARVNKIHPTAVQPIIFVVENVVKLTPLARLTPLYVELDVHLRYLKTNVDLTN